MQDFRNRIPTTRKSEEFHFPMLQFMFHVHRIKITFRRIDMLPSTDRFFTIFLMTLYILGCLFLISYCGTSPGTSAASPTSRDASVYTYKIINAYPHDRNAFTQGLVFEDGILYESTGLTGRSTLRKAKLETGKLLRCCKLPSQFFGEGLAVYGNRIIQLTWKAGTGFVYDRNSFDQTGTFEYSTEGWGLTHDGSRLIMSDGTSSLYFLDPSGFGVTGKIRVYDDQGPVVRLNELEYIRGEVYANIWQTDDIVRIDPQTGQVTGRIELQGLLNPHDTEGYPVDVLNGIAYDAKNDRLFVTGKLWPKLFEIELIQTSGVPK